MGEAAEKMAKLNGISREEQDGIAHLSHVNAARAWKDGTYAAEVMHVLPPPYDKPVARDNLVRDDSTLEAYAKLPPAFDRKHGTITAGNASPLTDGASALLVMRESKARALGYAPLGFLRTWAYAAVDPGWQLLMAPVFAAPRALHRAGLTLANMDLVDMHEAFAAQVASNLKALASRQFAEEHLGRSHAVGEVDPARLNVNGGSIAIGHPFAATGAHGALHAARAEEARRVARAAHRLRGRRPRRRRGPGGRMNGAPSQGLAAGALSLAVRPDGVAVVTYDVPGEPVNTLKASFAADFERIFAEIARDPAVVGAVLISGTRDGFIAGADIDMLKAARTAAEAEALCRTGHAALRRLADLPKPVVAAVHGAALGGGFEVALACHGRVLSDDRKTVFAFPEVQLGLLPGMNGLERLAAIVGLQVALDHGLTGKNMRAKKARSLGLADDVVPVSILLDVAAALARKLAEKGAPFGRRAPRKAKGVEETLTTLALERNPLGRRLLFRKAREGVREKTGGHYPAPERILGVLQVFAEQGFAAAAEVEAKAFGELVVSSVARRLIEVFFAQTALRKDTGVSDASVTPRRVERVVVLGAGMMGAGIAYVTLGAGIAVRLKDKDDEALGRGFKAVADVLDEDVKRKKLTRLERDQKLALLSGAVDYSGIRAADLVIEAVFEDLGVKHRVLREVEAACKDGVIFASNTSSIPIGEIAAASKRPENVVGMHYFSPVHKMPLLEVIQTKRTAPEVVATAVAVGKKQGKTVIVVNDGTGFYTITDHGPMFNEASYLHTECDSVEAIDHAMTSW